MSIEINNLIDIKAWSGHESVLNPGMMSAIGRATVWGPDVQHDPLAKFLREPLPFGDSLLLARFGEIAAHDYDPRAGIETVFDGSRPSMTGVVATKNLSRQIRLEVNDLWIRQYVQTPEMADDAVAAIMATANVAHLDDMYQNARNYFFSSLRSAQTTQIVTLAKKSGTSGFADALYKALWGLRKKFRFKSTAFNASRCMAACEDPLILLDQDVEFELAAAQAALYHGDRLEMGLDPEYIEAFPAVETKPAGAGRLLGVVVDPRAYAITPMPGGVTVESERLTTRRATLYVTTYEYALSAAPFFDQAWIFEPA